MRAKILATILLLLPFITHAKEFKATSFVKASDSYSGLYETRTDLNGDVCALLIVHLPTDGVTFENAVGNISHEQGCYYVYLSPGTRRIALKKDDTESLTVNFSSLSDIVSVKSGSQYDLKVEWFEGKGLEIKGLPSRGSRLSVDTIMTLPTDIGARRFEVRDANNERCALVRVNLPVPGCTFEGNIGDVKQEVNEYQVYISSADPNLTINCPGIKPLQLHLDDIEPGSTYRVRLSGYDTSLHNITPELRSLLSKYNDISDFWGQFALCYKNDKMGVINVQGEEIVPCIYDAERPFVYYGGLRLGV